MTSAATAVVPAPMTAVACGLGLGAGMAGLAWSWWGHRTSSAADRGDEVAPGSSAAPTTRSSRLRLRHGWVLLGASAGGVVAMLVTGWAVAVPIGALAIIGLPKLFRQTSNSTAISRIEAIATWTEMLQGTLAASAGIGQAIVATAPLAPLPIRSATTKLSARLEAGAQPREALLQFADDVADPSADRVVCALLLAVAARGQRLGDLLTALADTTRDEVALRLRIETARASVRSGVRTVLVFSVAFAFGLAVLAHAYLAPFGTPQGQAVLCAVAALYAGGLVLMVALARPPAPVRLLGAEVSVR